MAVGDKKISIKTSKKLFDMLPYRLFLLPLRRL
nr:MAG TPA: hypothetical protein [Caudoviricetes sp.]